MQTLIVSVTFSMFLSVQESFIYKDRNSWNVWYLLLKFILYISRVCFKVLVDDYYINLNCFYIYSSFHVKDTKFNIDSNKI